METTDFIALVMIVLLPVFVLIGAFIFFCRNKAAWDTEIAALQKSRKHEKDQKNQQDKV